MPLADLTGMQQAIHPLRRTGMRLAVLALLGMAPEAYSQVVLDAGPLHWTAEAYANLTAGDSDSTRDHGPSDSSAGAQFDGGVRLLGRLQLDQGPDIGLRLAAEVSDSDARLAEASVLLFGRGGRLEIGERMGLPDVLTGYAPNNFQFTSAEFGPASGSSLDPAGRLQTAFLPASVAGQLDQLTGLGVAAAMFDDRSPKVLYVSPKERGWIGGISYAGDADDESIGQLVLAGMTLEHYWQQHLLRWGATYAYGQADDDQLIRDVNSVGLGMSLTLDDALTLGVAASYDGRSRLPRAAHGQSASGAWGATVSANYNSGPWTMGAYYQDARAEGSPLEARNDRLRAFEVGASYRFTTKLRLYGAFYWFDLDDDDRSDASASDVGHVVLVGARLTL